jgi:hypothetical protein
LETALPTVRATSSVVGVGGCLYGPPTAAPGVADAAGAAVGAAGAAVSGCSGTAALSSFRPGPSVGESSVRVYLASALCPRPRGV